MRRLLGLFISLGLATTGTAAAELLPPVGDHLAELLAPAMRKEDEAVARQLQRALAADPTWFQAYLKSQRVQPGEPLPYHQKLGVTKDQYESFLRSSKKMTLEKVADVVVRVEKAGDKTILSITGAPLPVSTFQFSPDGKSMTCAFGSTTAQGQVNQDDEASMTGRWHGTQWTLTEGQADLAGTGDAFEVRLAVGADAKSRGVVYLRVVGRREGRGLDTAVMARWPR